MAVRKLPSGKWLAELYPEGRPSKNNSQTPHIRRPFATRGEAPAFERLIKDPEQRRPWLDCGAEADEPCRWSWPVASFLGRNRQALRRS